MQITIYPDINTLSHEAAQYIVRLANEAIVTHGRFTIALSGGSTPKVLYGLLGDEPYRSQIDWVQVDIFWSDERCVPPDSEESNYHLAQQVLLNKIPIPASQVHRMPADQPDRDIASQAYTEEMQRTFGTNGIPNFDLIQLEIRSEEHTSELQSLAYLVCRLLLEKKKQEATAPLKGAAAHAPAMVRPTIHLGLLDQHLWRSEAEIATLKGAVTAQGRYSLTPSLL